MAETLDRRCGHRRSWRKARCCYAIEAITKRGFDLASQSWINRLSAPLIAFALAVGMSVSTVNAVGDARKVSVVSFGLFGDQGVFRREASGAALVVADRFGSGLINVHYNSKKGGAATIEALTMSLQAAANGMDAENDVLFLILTSHGSRAGLAVKAGRLSKRSRRLISPICWRGRACDTRWWSSRPAIPEFYPPSREPRYAGNHRGRSRPSVVRLPRTKPSGPISAMPFSMWHSGKLKV